MNSINIRTSESEYFLYRLFPPIAPNYIAVLFFFNYAHEVILPLRESLSLFRVSFFTCSIQEQACS